MKKISVTSLINKYKKPFDADKMAEIVANKNGVSKEEILKDWELKKNIGIRRGEIIHKYIEEFLSNDFKELDIEKGYESYKKLFLSWFSQNPYDKYMVEKAINYDYVFGRIDLCAIKNSTKQITLIDWKTSSNFTTSSNYKLINELSHLDDSNLTLASLQLWIYKILSEKIGFTLPNMDLKIVYFGDSCIEYEALELKEEANFILNNFWKNLEV